MLSGQPERIVQGSKEMKELKTGGLISASFIMFGAKHTNPDPIFTFWDSRVGAGGNEKRNPRIYANLR